METINGIEVKKDGVTNKPSYEDLEKRCNALISLVNRQNEQIEMLNNNEAKARLSFLIEIAGNKVFPEVMRKPMQKEIIMMLYPEVAKEGTKEEENIDNTNTEQ